MTSLWGIWREVRRFRRDREGQTAMIFGLAAIPIMMMAGAAIDFSRAATQHSNLQQASDAAVLSATRYALSSASTTSTLTTAAQTYLNGVMVNATITNLTLDPVTRQICIKTAVNVPTTLMQIAHISFVPVAATACAQPPTSSTYEVAMALDNSGSMAESAGGQSKVAALQTAAQQLVNILNPAGTTQPNAAISLVPFTALVNVGTSTSAAFLDTAGQSSIHWQNFHRPAATLLAPFYPKSKLDLFAAMNTSWGGCVEERPVPLATTDTAASASSPDSLFVPFLSPDDPGDTNPNHCFYVNPATQTVSDAIACSNLGTGLLNVHQFYNSYIYDTGAINVPAACLLNPTAALADTLPNLIDNQPNIFPAAGATMVCKYKGASPAQVSYGTGVTSGPNFLCSSQQLTPLTTNRTTLSNAISTMQAGGSTNLATGFMWAWRTISPVVNPFPVASPSAIGPQNPKSYASAAGAPTTNTKIIILMTDGFNSWTTNNASPWLSTYEAFGYYANNRIASYGDCNNAPGTTVATTASDYRCQMDNVTLSACANAKAAGVTIYTVGFTIPSDPIDAQGIALLKSCASSTANYFQASDGAGIVSAFQQIGQQIVALRLTR